MNKTLILSRSQVVEGAWFRPGQHVNAVGAPPRPDHREIDAAGMARAGLSRQPGDRDA
ncbi:hypothetical protein [Amaricoccus solimangrovi]|uniref:hypothetical protein n=1 Tax=Amaricoccus solimangrovi TaxID=2589815 RepID=UPI0015E35EE3|nr:hypothetical protein [Amaricoccus solimangrovi]